MLLYSLLLFSEGRVVFGRFSGFDNALIDGIKYTQLGIWALIALRLYPKKRKVLPLILLVFGSFLCWFGTELIQGHERQFFHAFIISNVFGALLILFENIKIRASLLALFMVLIVASYLNKSLGIATGITSEHDYIETQYTYHDTEHKILKSKITKKGYENLGERLEFHKNGRLKFYEDYDKPYGTPWLTYLENGVVRNIACKGCTDQTINPERDLYTIYFDDQGMPMNIYYSNGPVIEYHYNGFVFSSGQNQNGKPFGTWYWYSYTDGKVVDSVLDVTQAPREWDKQNHLRTNRYRSKDSASYAVRYDQLLMNGAQHYTPDSLHAFALEIQEKFDYSSGELE